MGTQRTGRSPQEHPWPDERAERSPALDTINAIAKAFDLQGSELMRLAEEQQTNP